ncbi:unnamed protein product [Dicrocoelium dendriticum]|nr:unnamed protein product [Dicrocoelium dendriticum]
MEFLPEVDEELDYNEEELPTISNRDSSNHRKANLGTRKFHNRSPHFVSPREEGEEYSDDDLEEPTTSHTSKSKRVHAGVKRRGSRDREEGEASSDDDQRRFSGSDFAAGKETTRDKRGTTKLILDEAEYRHRLHERHERRKRERVLSNAPNADLKQGSFIRESHSEFLQPRSKFESSSSSDQNNAHSDEAPLENKLQSEKAASVSSQRDVPELAHRRSRHKRSSRDESGSVSHSNTRSDGVSRSYSSSYLLYEQVMEAVTHYQPDSGSTKEGRKSKAKKSKRDRHEKLREDSKKASKTHKAKSSVQIDYVDWESYVYGQSMGKRNRSPNPVLTTSPKSSRTSSSSSSSSSPIARRSTSVKSFHDSSASHKHSTQFESQPSHSRHKHRHKYRREVRESAPPPEPLRPQISELELSRSSKAEKHRLKESTTTFAYPFKRSRSSRDSKEPRSRSQPQGSSEPKPREHHSSDATTTVTDESAALKLRLSGLSSRNPYREESASDLSDDHSLEEQVDETAPDKTITDIVSNTHENPVIKHETKTDRLKHYRLYSESEASDEHDNSDDRSDGKSERKSEDELSSAFNSADKPTSQESGESRSLRAPSKPFYFPSIQGCRSVEEFECLNRIEEGTYGVVYRARDKKINEIVALKRLKMEKERDGFPITSLREINTLMKAQHENIVTVREVVVGSNMDKIYLVMDYVEHDLKSLMEIMNGPFSVGEVKCLLLQLLRAVRHLHDNWILHRDLKTSNLLLSHQGILKVGDFGLAREYGSPLKHYTEVVVTLWYRAPELLLGVKQYTCPIDLWSVGCIFAEFLLQRPLFPGKGEVDELNIIFRDLGTPTERIWPGVSQLPGMKKCIFTEYPYNQLRRRFTEKQISDQGFDLLNSFLTYCPEKRITAEKALTHAYFNERPRAIHPSMFPSWPAKSEGNVAVRRMASPRPPAGGGALAAAAAAVAAAAAASGNGRVRYQPPAPPMGGQGFYSSMGGDSKQKNSIGSGDLISGGQDKGFLLRF